MKAQAGKLIPLILTFATLTPLTASAQPVPSYPHYSHSQLKQLIRDAHTPQQYQALAAYFRSREDVYNNEAAIEKAEWDRRKTITASPELKYPSAVDSAHNLYDYYVTKANAMATLASTYEQRSR